MIKVYQIQLTDAEIAAIRNNGNTTPRIQAYLSRSFDSMFKAENFQYYDHVATIYGTEDMEDAFRVMNLWDGGATSGIDVVKHGPCSSMSVGDILEVGLLETDGTKYRCASFGFDAI